MSSQQETPTTTVSKTGIPKWAVRAIVAVVGIAVLVIAYFILAAFIPRWWAGRIGNMVAGSFTRGISWGLFFGLVCTLVPLLLLLFGGLRLRGRGGKVIAPLCAILALLTAVPNLMTLTVVLGTGTGAHAGQRIMDVEAPAFRGSTLIGAIVALLVFLGVCYYVARYRKRGRDLRRARDREAIDVAVDKMERSERRK